MAAWPSCPHKTNRKFTRNGFFVVEDGVIINIGGYLVSQEYLVLYSPVMF